MKSLNFYATCLLLLFTQSFAFAQDYSQEYEIKKITFLNVNSSINPATFNYLQSNLEKLSFKNGDLVFIKLDTPGGLVSTTKDILTLIGSRDIPVGVWITPEGASATSAGAIIASGAHFLVMSEGTNIGAATPIGMSGDIKHKDSKSKAVNDLVALVTSLSKARGRNAKYFEQMISKAKSLDARLAVKENVIDGIINNKTDLINFLNTRTTHVKGKLLKISISQTVETNFIEMDPGQLILNIFANPTTAYVLFIIGAALIYFEMQAPGGMVAGGIGAVFLCLAGIGFQVLPLNFGAMALIVLSFILFVLEVYITSFGILSLAGIVSLVFGSLFLFRTENSLIELETKVVVSVVAAIAIYIISIGWYFIKTWKKTINYFTNKNERGEVIRIISLSDTENHYQVKVHGEIWNAISTEKLNISDQILIIKSNEDKLELTISKQK